MALGRSILVIVWHLLSNAAAWFHDLGPGLLRLTDQTQNVRSATTSANSKPSVNGEAPVVVMTKVTLEPADWNPWTLHGVAAGRRGE